MKAHAVEQTNDSKSRTCKAVTRRSATLAFAALLSLGAMVAAHSTEEPVEAAITKQLKGYEQALNASDLEGVLKLYAEDAVFMPPNNMPVVGREAVRGAYQHLFDAVKLDLRFTIDEIRPLSRDWAFARTRSNGTAKLLAGDQPAGPEANKEIFLLRREADGQWRFARYIFSTTTPRKQS